MNHRHRWALLGAAPIAAFLLNGCLTPQAQPPDSDERVFEAVDGAIGTVVFVDLEEQVALVQVRSSSTRARPALISRNEGLVETARLEPTRFQRGRTLGTRILSGLPNVGDEVIVGQ